MRSRILFAPEFRDLDQVRDVLARAAFHLAHIEPERLSFVVGEGMVQPAQEALRSFTNGVDFDPVVVDQVERVAPSVTFIEAGSPEAIRAGDMSDVIAVWDTPRFKTSMWAMESGRRTPFLSIFDVDAATNRLEASEFALLAQKVLQPSVAVEARRFRRMLDQVGRASDVYLFGSGPSIAEAMDLDFSSGVRIVCNTVILDRELMDHVRPQILTFADPIFHFGPSIYGAGFRTALREALSLDTSLWVVIPLRYRALLVDLLPEFEVRIIGVPQLGGSAPLVLDLRERFGVKSFPNILTMLMLPLAATMGRRIGLIGFDGREPDEDYFWTHGARVQLHDDMPAIKRVHPGFFDLDYEDYYSTHLATLEHTFEICESRGIVVEGTSHSFMPCLVRRSSLSEEPKVEWATPEGLVGRSGTAIVSIDPDWMDDFGHHGPWFKAIAVAATERGIPSFSLASRAIRSQGRSDVLPTFSYPSVNPGAANMYSLRFESELAAAVAQVLESAPELDLVLSFYTADLWHLPAIIRLAQRYPGRVRAAVNLMRSHKAIADAARAPNSSANWWKHGVRELIALGQQVGVLTTADSEELATLVSDICEVDVPVWPMATASTVRAVPAHEGNESNKSLRFYCPSQSQESKGILEFTAAATTLLSSSWAGTVGFQMRSIDQPARTNTKIVDAIARAESAGVEVLTGSLSDEAYAEAIQRSDVVVIPYRIDPFRTRTSSVVVDAMRAAKPVVVAAGTWGGHLVESAGSGVLFRSGDANDLARAMGEAANRFNSLSRRAAEAAVTITEQFAMSRLVEFLVEIGRVKLPGADDGGSRLVDVEAILAAHRDGEIAGAQKNRNWAAHLLLRASDAEVKIERFTTRMEELGRAVSDRDTRYERLSQANDLSKTQRRELLDNVRLLEGERQELKQRAKDLSEDRERLVNEAAATAKRVTVLEQRFGNRVLAAMRRRIAR